MTVSASAGSLRDIDALVQPFAPALAARIDAAAGPASASVPAHVKLALDLAKDAAGADRVDARATLDLDASQLKATTVWTAKPKAASLRGFDLDAIGRTELAVDTKLSAEQGSTLLALLGLDHVAVAGNGPAQFEAHLAGAWRAPLKVNAKLSGVGLDGEVQGTAEPWAEGAKSEIAKANLNLRVRTANLSPLVGLQPQDPAAQNVRLFGRLGLAGNRLTLDELDGLAGGAKLGGHLAVTLDGDKQVDGEINLDTLDIPAVFALGIGAAGHDAAEPLGTGLLNGWRGRVAFQAASGRLPGGIELRPATGAINNDGQALDIGGF